MCTKKGSLNPNPMTYSDPVSHVGYFNFGLPNQWRVSMNPLNLTYELVYSQSVCTCNTIENWTRHLSLTSRGRVACPNPL